MRVPEYKKLSNQTVAGLSEYAPPAELLHWQSKEQRLLSYKFMLSMHNATFPTHPFMNAENRRPTPSFRVQAKLWVSSATHHLHHILVWVLEMPDIFFVMYKRFTQVMSYQSWLSYRKPATCHVV
jgi:hypothetical protein